MEEEKKRRLSSPVAESAKTFTELEIESFTCAITGEIMRDPVTVADGHSYERAAIEEWFNNGHNTNPRTNDPLPNLDLKPNHNLRHAIEEFKSVQEQFSAQQQQTLVATQTAEESKRASTALQADLLKEFGLNSDNNRPLIKQTFLQAVHAFHLAMYAELTKHRKAWDAQASNTFVSTVIRCLRKKEFNALVLDPESQGIPAELKPFISQYVTTHADLSYAKNYPMLTKTLERQLLLTPSPELLRPFTDQPGDAKSFEPPEPNDPPERNEGASRPSCLVM